MISVEDYKQKQIEKLKDRLQEIMEIVGLETTLNMSEREDAFGIRIKEKNVELMREYYREMTSIKCEIARLEGRTSFFEDEN